MSLSRRAFFTCSAAAVIAPALPLPEQAIEIEAPPIQRFLTWGMASRTQLTAQFDFAAYQTELLRCIAASVGVPVDELMRGAVFHKPKRNWIDPIKESA